MKDSCYVQIRRGGFQNPAPWGEKDSFPTLEAAKEHIFGVASMADKYNCCIDYKITDESGQLIQGG